MEKEIHDLGKVLGVEEEDIKSMKKERFKRYIFYLTVIIFSTITGFFMGMLSPTSINYDSYPFSTASVGSVSLKSKKDNIPFTIITMILAVISFVATYKFSQTLFGVAIMYNVYRRK